MKKILFKALLICVVIILCIFFSCESKPTKPEYNNVFDPGNPTTSGDPFELQVNIGNGGVTLNWKIPDIQNLNSFKIYRSEQELAGFTEISTAPSNITEYTDRSVENGHSYWYKITAIDGKGNETSNSNISAININTNPVLVINSGDNYTPSKEVNLTILANTAQQMMLSNSSDFTGSTWETYSTTKNWTLNIGTGEKIVFMKVKYSDNTESTVVADVILPQPMNPSIKTVSGSNYTSIRIVEFILNVSGNIIEFKISEDSSFAGMNWQHYTPQINFQLSQDEGVKPIYTQFKNDFEIVSTIIKKNIILDMTPPVPTLIVTPDSGITNETIFQVDPTGSYDNFFPSESLIVRFDWENDGKWDTDWSGLSIKNYQYTIGGGDNTVSIQIKDGAGWDTITTSQIFINTRPVALITVTRDAINDSLFHFDASSCFDYEDGTNIKFRWDFEGDGTWDTHYTTFDTISHTFTIINIYHPKLEIKDSNGLTNSHSTTIVVGCVDINGNSYEIVKIGNQWWMAENLKVTHYLNGDAIPHVNDPGTWKYLTFGAYCNYNNDISIADTYGRLYNGYTILDSRNLAPIGWHVPTDDEWKELEMYLGMSQTQANATGWRGTDEGDKLKESGPTHWNSPNTGTNSSGITALPGGYRNGSNGLFYSIGYNGFWWSSTQDGTTNNWHRNLRYNYSQIGRYNNVKQNGFSLRCVRD